TAWLEEHREAINALNVFPVPDGDTGTNMSLTMRAAVKEITDVEDPSAAVIAEKLSRGALMGARGNSGVILSQILRGLSHGLEGKTTFTASDFAAALQESARMAYRAVIKPVEGTILTVIRESAEAAHQSAGHGSDITMMLEDTVHAAHLSVAKTPDLLPTLKQAGVVDAGGQGLAIILEGMWRYARGETVEMTTQERQEEASEFHRGRVEIDEEFGYEVVFLLRGENLNLEEIRDTINAMGGVSTVIAGDATLIKVHTHTPHPGQILDYGVSLGSLQDINIENLQEQSLRYAAESAREHGGGTPPASGTTDRAAPSANGMTVARDLSGYGAAVATPPSAAAPGAMHTTEIGIVAVVAGEGWSNVYRSLGVTAIVPGGQTMNPSTQELLEAVESCPTEKVILLPNNSNVILSARQVPQLTRKQVYIVPTVTLPQGITALLAFNFETNFETNCQAMEDAIKRVQTAEITQAVRSVRIDDVEVSEGDIIGLVNGHLVTAGRDMAAILHETLTRMGVERFEIITLYYGTGIAASVANEMAQRIKEWFPAQEIEVVDGGQPYYAYIVSAE
ncbi:MAG: DAK2 domain-containing protein, partial [Ktedonobacterales bacterium]|nr:DAK2 domain-containing protein [Ktedonobacterales bacterium]